MFIGVDAIVNSAWREPQMIQARKTVSIKWNVVVNFHASIKVKKEVPHWFEDYPDFPSNIVTGWILCIFSENRVFAFEDWTEEHFSLFKNHGTLYWTAPLHMRALKIIPCSKIHKVKSRNSWLLSPFDQRVDSPQIVPQL